MSDDAPRPNEQLARTRAIIPPGPAGRMALAGMPVERSENFGQSAKRLLGRLRPERARAILVICFAVASVTMAVLGPRILGKATNVIVDGLRGKNGATGIDFGKLHHILFIAAA
jgi:ATP-binding cassette subfamily B protein